MADSKRTIKVQYKEYLELCDGDETAAAMLVVAEKIGGLEHHLKDLSEHIDNMDPMMKE